VSRSVSALKRSAGTGSSIVNPIPSSVVKSVVQHLGDLCGLHITDARNTLSAKRTAVLKRHSVDLALDVGANTGQWAMDLRRSGYRGRVVSFEPIAVAFKQLAIACSRSVNHECIQLALGNFDGEAQINVSENVVSSSLLPVCDTSVAACLESRTANREHVTAARLDTLAPVLLQGARATFLKLDVQGYEREVLQGAIDTLPRVSAIEVELSLRELYRGQALMHDIGAILHSAGFFPVWLERAFVEPETGFMLQVDALFVRSP
jgi:FkbM family methyltransferase